MLASVLAPKYREKKKRSTTMCQMSNSQEGKDSDRSFISRALMRRKVTTFPKHTSMPSLSECEDFSMEGYM